MCMYVCAGGRGGRGSGSGNNKFKKSQNQNTFRVSQLVL